MAEDKIVVTLDSFEQRLLVGALTDFRNELIREERPTEDVDGLLLKVIDAAPQKRSERRQTVRHDKFSQQNLLLYCLGTIPVVWLALRIAPFMEDGLPGLIRNFGAAMSRPFHITLCGNSLKTILVLLLCYRLAIGIYLSTQRNYRRREEHGSAQWGSPVQVNRKYADKVPTQNKILTQNVSVGLDGRKHRRNLNTLVCGGSGAGKTRFFAKPNLCQVNSSYVVLDPKGELLRDTGNLLSAKGTTLRCWISSIWRKAIATTRLCICAATTISSVW